MADGEWYAPKLSGCWQNLSETVGLRFPFSCWLSASADFYSYRPLVIPCHVIFSIGNSQYVCFLLQDQQENVFLQSAKMKSYITKHNYGKTFHHICQGLLLRSKPLVLLALKREGIYKDMICSKWPKGVSTTGAQGFHLGAYFPLLLDCLNLSPSITTRDNIQENTNWHAKFSSTYRVQSLYKKDCKPNSICYMKQNYWNRWHTDIK